MNRSRCDAVTGGYIYFETSREPPRQPSILLGLSTSTDSNNIDVGGVGNQQNVVSHPEPVNDFESAVLATRNISATGPQVRLFPRKVPQWCHADAYQGISVLASGLIAKYASVERWKAQ